MKGTSRRNACLGLVEVTIGASPFLLLALQPLLAAIFNHMMKRLWPFFFVLPIGPLLFIAMVVALVFVAMKLLIKGFRNLVRSRKCSGFE